MKQFYFLIIIALIATSCSSKKSDDPTPEPPIAPGKEENIEPKPISKYLGILTPYVDGQPNTSRNAIFDSESYDEYGKVIMKEYQVGLIDQQLPYTYRLDYQYSNDDITVVTKQATVPKLSSYEEIHYTDSFPMYTLYLTDTKLLAISENEYNGNGQLIRTFRYDMVDGAKKLVTHDSLVYENNLLKDHYIISDEQEWGTQKTFIYDSKGKIIKELYTNMITGAKAVQAEYIYLYNDKNQLTEYTVDYSGLRHKHINEYNNEGRIKVKKIYKGTIYSANLEQTGVVHYTYTYSNHIRADGFYTPVSALARNPFFLLMKAFG